MKHFTNLCQKIIYIDCKFNELVALANMAADLLFDDDDIPQLTMALDSAFGDETEVLVNEVR